MKARDVINIILKDNHQSPQKNESEAFAPNNIALCKYWGKRDKELNLPVTSSLSISLPTKGTKTRIIAIDSQKDEYFLNGEPVADDTLFTTRAKHYLDLFRFDKRHFFRVETHNNIPLSAGLASSASGFAALAKALNDLFEWHLPDKELSILARLGSGSACRSIYNGFVEWEKGNEDDGMDSYAKQIKTQWPELRIGLMVLDQKEKPINSREAMERTVESSPFYRTWPNVVAEDLKNIKHAIAEKDFALLGKTAEANAMAMHGTMMAARPSVVYSTSATLAMIQKVLTLRKNGLPVYFTQDAGPNIKLLFLEKDHDRVCQELKDVEVITLF
ncbi:MAG: diphosphomevalonate decarboxylase [Gammaproteobacteria bacterium]